MHCSVSTIPGIVTTMIDLRDEEMARRSTDWIAWISDSRKGQYSFTAIDAFLLFDW